MSWDLDSLYIDAALVSPTPAQFVLASLLPVGLTVLAGPAKRAQKTTWSLVLAAHVAEIPAPCVHPALPTHTLITGPVLIHSAEDTPGDLKQSLKQLGIEVPPNGSLLICRDTGKVRLDDRASLKRTLKLAAQIHAKLVIFDPLVEFHSLDENNASDMSSLLSPLRSWAHANEASVLVVHHTGKPREGSAGAPTRRENNVRGSSAIMGKVDGMILLDEATGGGQDLQFIGKHAAPWDGHFTLDLKTGERLEQERQLSSLETLALNYFRACEKSGEEPSTKDLASALHVSREKVSSVLSRLVLNKQLTREGRCYRLLDKEE